mmetsp:Transcript_31922/g.56312  ORF Transcript_31922/g.56312 Transcript_31922/m.56312 type:complete len:221 (+) Transcript_31922:166-828(+)
MTYSSRSSSDLKSYMLEEKLVLWAQASQAAQADPLCEQHDLDLGEQLPQSDNQHLQPLVLCQFDRLGYHLHRKKDCLSPRHFCLQPPILLCCLAACPWHHPILHSPCTTPRLCTPLPRRCVCTLGIADVSQTSPLRNKRACDACKEAARGSLGGHQSDSPSRSGRRSPPQCCWWTASLASILEDQSSAPRLECFAALPDGASSPVSEPCGRWGRRHTAAY